MPKRPIIAGGIAYDAMRVNSLPFTDRFVGPYLTDFPNRDRQFLVYCHSGMRSSAVASTLRREGFHPAPRTVARWQDRGGRPFEQLARLGSEDHSVAVVDDIGQGCLLDLPARAARAS